MFTPSRMKSASPGRVERGWSDRRHRRTTLRVEELEPKVAPALQTIPVTSLDGSALAAAILKANRLPEGDTAKLDLTGLNGTMELRYQLPTMERVEQIVGPGAQVLKIARKAGSDEKFPIFTFATTLRVTIRDLSSTDALF